MDKIKSALKDFLVVISSNSISFLGALITTISVFLFFIFLGVSFFTLNNYIGILGFVIIPMFFLGGLLLIPLGFFLYRRKIGFGDLKDVSPSAFMNRLKISKPRSVVTLILALTIINLSILAVVGYESFHYMESNIFCGTLCHEVMNPEYTAYQDSVHSRVNCVECHIGEGAGPLVKSKISGTRQMFAVMFNTYHKPIKTPIHNLRPARETCEQCHWPQKFHGQRLLNIINYASDEKNTPSQTTLLLNIGSASPELEGGIHRHISEDFKVEYISENDEREKILWVKLTSRDGAEKVYSRESYQPTEEELHNAREMDCIDCHNRATHEYESLQKALRKAMQFKLIDPSIPYIKREAEKVLQTEIKDKDKAIYYIKTNLKKFYENNYPKLLEEKKWAIEKAIEEIVKIYSRNIHPEMNITWGTYPSHIGHTPDLDEFPGCFRCHNYDLKTKSEETISQDCELCHHMIKYSEAQVEDLKTLMTKDQ